MKVLFPRDIPKGMFSMHLTVGPVTITIVQMFILALGAAVSLAVFNGITKTGSGSKLGGIIASLFVILVFVIIAFFKLSEMWLLECGAKFLRKYFFDTTKKFQTNFLGYADIDISLAKLSSNESQRIMENKEYKLDKTTFDQIENSGLL